MDRQQGHGVQAGVAFGAFRLMPRERTLYRHDVPVPLTARAFDVLVALVARAGTVVAKEDLIAAVWPRTVVGEGNLRVHIGALRKALGNDRTCVENVPGRGYRFALPVAAVVPDAAAAPRGWAPPAPLIGRGPVLEQLARALPEARLLTIAGPGGMGKTAVASALATRCAALFDGRVHGAELAALTDPALLPGAVAQALGVSADEVFAAAPGGRRRLLILDGCEHLLDAAAALALRLLRDPALHIVATTREPLRLDAERVYRLPALAVPAAGAATVVDLAGCPSVQLFAERARAGGGFALDDANAAAVAAVCRRLDGIPLALELAAGRAAFLGAHELANRLSDCFAVLTRGRRTAPPRQRTLRATLDWSHGLLVPAQQGVLRRLALFRGPFTAAAALAVAQALPEHLAQLAAKSLLSVEAGRFRLLETTRLYALEKLREHGEERVVARRYTRYWCDSLGRPEQGAHVNIGDVRAALDLLFGPAAGPLAGARTAAVTATATVTVTVTAAVTAAGA